MGGVCTDGKPTTSVKEGLSAAKNVEEEEFLEGQAFYASLAPSQYVLPKVNSVAVTQTATAARVTATTANQGLGSNAACTGTGYSAVEYPLWLVGIGGGTSPASYAVPNGYCYANACLEDFAAVGTATAFKGV